MNHNIPLQALGGFFAVVGVALFLLAFRPAKPVDTAVPPKKSELREQADRQKESGKLRLAGLLLFVFGVILVLIF
jgi:hypothetical protein